MIKKYSLFGTFLGLLAIVFCISTARAEKITKFKGNINQDATKIATEKASRQSISRSNFHLESFAFGSYSSIKMNTGTESPKLAQFGLGVSVGHWLRDWCWVGLTSDYRFINQYSTPTVTSGNFRGSYWNYGSPSVGKQFGRIKTKMDIHYFGKYWLKNKTASGKETSYKSPLGLRVTGLYPLPILKEKLHAGGLLEFIHLRKQTIGSIDYDSSKKLWQAGVIATFVF